MGQKLLSTNSNKILTTLGNIPIHIVPSPDCDGIMDIGKFDGDFLEIRATPTSPTEYSHGFCNSVFVASDMQYQETILYYWLQDKHGNIIDQGSSDHRTIIIKCPPNSRLYWKGNGWHFIHNSYDIVMESDSIPVYVRRFHDARGAGLTQAFSYRYNVETVTDCNFKIVVPFGNLVSIDSWDNSRNIHNLDFVATECRNLKTIPATWPNTDSTGILSMYQAFYNCHSLEAIPVSWGNLNTRVATEAFRNCKSLKHIPDSWGNLFTDGANASSMFRGCSSLENCPSNFMHLTRIGVVSSMFRDCTSLKNLPDFSVLDNDARNWPSMSHMFEGCTGYTDEIGEDRCYFFYQHATRAPERVQGIFKGMTNAVDYNKLSTDSRYSWLFT